VLVKLYGVSSCCGEVELPKVEFGIVRARSNLVQCCVSEVK
jgi:hypothetical protein